MSTNTAPTPPPTLAQQLDQMIDNTKIKHAEIVCKIGELGLELFESDAEVMRSLEAVVASQARRASEITGLMHTIASRIGYVPPPEHAALFAGGDPRIGKLDYTPAAVGGVH